MPNPNHYAVYPVIFKYKNDLPVYRDGDRKEHGHFGYAGFLPTENYTRGKWVDIKYPNNNTPDELEVLYWIDIADFPKTIEV